jgi:hypothetical protein
MNFYKFRALTTEDELKNVKEIIETGKFWCSSFSELNDPMEGVFKISQINAFKDIYKDKQSFRICSFSRIWAIRNPAMWGYYAGGGKGVAIRIEIDKTKLHKISYEKEVPYFENKTPGIIPKILSTKLNPWKHEREYRFLIKSSEDKHKIGKISAIYYSEPYGHTLNAKDIYNDNVKLRGYQEFIRELIEIAESNESNNIACIPVKVEKSRIVW